MGQITFFANYIGLTGRNGAYLSALDTLIALLTTSHTVTAVSQIAPNIPKEIAGYQLNRPHQIKIPQPFPGHLDRTFPRRWASWLAGLQHVRQLKTLEPDLLLVNSLNNTRTMDALTSFGLASAKKSAVIIRSAPSSYYFKNMAWAIRVMAQYDYLIFVSSQIRQSWLEIAELARKANFVIPNCCQEDRVATLINQSKTTVRQRLGLPLDRLVVVCVASIQPRKGQDLLVQQFPLLLSRLPSLNLILIGPAPEKWGQTLCAKITDSPWEEHLRYLGAKLDALSYIYAADILVLPSRAEALGRVILEAMALKTAVVASDVGGIPELIQDEQTGLLFDINQPQTLVEAFSRLGNDLALRNKLARQAHRRYWTHFSQHQQIERYREAIQVMMV